MREVEAVDLEETVGEEVSSDSSQEAEVYLSASSSPLDEPKIDKKWIDNNKELVQNSYYAIWAVYEKDPVSFLNGKSQYHTLKRVHANHVGTWFLLAKDKNSRVYLAFKGTDSMEDVKSNSKIKQSKAKRPKLEGSLHTGFAEVADAFPLDLVLKAKGFKGKTLITCGHSLGGAVSSIIYANIAAESGGNGSLLPRGIKTIKNITFGSPLFGDTQLKQYLQQTNHENGIINLVNKGDIVPSLLCCSNNEESILQNSRWLTNCANKVIKLTAGKLFNGVKNFCQDVDDASNQFTPIGTFVFFQEENLREDEVNAYKATDIEKIKEKISECSVLSGVKKHFLQSFKNIMDTKFCQDYRDVGRFKLLNPVINTFRIETGPNMEIVIEGKNLEASAVTKCSLKEHEDSDPVVFYDFSDTSKGSAGESRRSNVLRFTRSYEELSLESMHKMRLILVETMFGQPCEFKRPEPGSCVCDKEQSLSIILEITLLRHLAFSKLSPQFSDRSLRQVIDEVGHLMKAFPEIKEHELIDEEKRGAIQKLRTNFTKPLKLYVKKPTRKIVDGANKTVGPKNFLWLYPESRMRSKKFRHARLLCIGYERKTKKGVDENYRTVVKYIRSHLIRNQTESNISGSSQVDYRNDVIRSEVEIYNWCSQRRKITFAGIQDWISLPQESKDEIEIRITQIEKIPAIRKLVNTQTFIGLIGAENAGKTLLLNKLRGISDNTDAYTNTEKLEIFKIDGTACNISSDVFLVDFPGFDAAGNLEDGTITKKDAYNLYTKMNNLLILMLKNQVKLTETDMENIIQLYKMTEGVINQSKIIICFNKSEKELQDIKEAKFRNCKELAERFVFDIKNYVENRHTVRNQTGNQTGFSVGNLERNLFLTDWKLSNAGKKFGIKGPDDIRKEITMRLKIGGIAFESAKPLIQCEQKGTR